MASERLIAAILELSRAKEWEQAKLEWRLERAYEDVEGATCLCGHHPIHDMCVVANDATKKQAAVGNCCVKKFLGIDSAALFAALRRTRLDPERPLGEAAILWAKEQGWVSDWEAAIYAQAGKKGSSSGPQAELRSRINKDFVRRMSEGGAKAERAAKPEGRDFY